MSSEKVYCKLLFLFYREFKNEYIFNPQAQYSFRTVTSYGPK